MASQKCFWITAGTLRSDGCGACRGLRFRDVQVSRRPAMRSIDVDPEDTLFYWQADLFTNLKKG